MPDNIFKVVFLIGFITGGVIRGISVFRVRHWSRKKQDRIKNKHETWLDKILLFLVFIGMQVLPLFYVFSSWLDFADYLLPAWPGWVGVAVFAAALWLLWKSHTDLGLNWSQTLEIKEEHSLVTHGVFRYIRHPMYAAHLLWGIAQALLLHNWIEGLAFLVSFFPLYFRRIQYEEQMLLDHFGEEYRSYMNQTGRIIPRFWG